MKSYKDLRIYQDAFDIALRIRIETLKLGHLDRFEIGSQIRRSSTSIFSNIAEGYGSKSYSPDSSYTVILLPKKQGVRQILFIKPRMIKHGL